MTTKHDKSKPMNAINFIQQNGIEKAREIVEGAPEFPVFGYCALTGSYIFKRKDATAYYHNETNCWSEEYAIELILLDELKRLVESVDIVKELGSLESAKANLREIYSDSICDWVHEKARLYDYKHLTVGQVKQAIADYESIGGAA